MSALITTVLDTQINAATPTFTDWFSNSQFLVFQSSDTGEYFAQVSPGPIGSIERLVTDWRSSINTIDLIRLPEKLDCFPLRLLVNPSFAFHARILIISCY